MMVVRISQASGATNRMEIDVTPEQIHRWQNGELIQDAMPDLTLDEREFIMTGTTAEEWAEMAERWGEL